MISSGDNVGLEDEAFDYDKEPFDGGEDIENGKKPIKVAVRSGADVNTICMLSNRNISSLIPDAFYDVTVFGVPAVNVAPDQLTGIRAHKCVLAKASAHLMELFTADDYTDSNKSEYKFGDVQHGSLKDIIDLIYTDLLVMEATGDTFVNRMQNMLIAAKYLVINDVSDACESFLAGNSQSRLDNYVAMWRFARRYACFNLMEVSSIGIANNLPEITKQNDFLNLAFDEVVKLLLSEPFIVADSDQRCLAAVAWLDHDADNRGKHTVDVMNMVPAEIGLICRDTIARLCESDIIQEQVPKLIPRLFLNSVKRFKANPLSDTVSEKQLQGFLQRDAWAVTGGDYPEFKQFVQYDLLRRHWEMRLLLPWKRQSDTTILRDRIVAIGGVSDSRLSAAVDEYKFSTCEWIRNKTVRLQRWRGGMATCGDSNNNAYVFGGDHRSTLRSTGCMAERYDIDGDDCKKVSRLTSVPVQCLYAAATYDHANHAVYITGGSDLSIISKTCDKLNSIYRYDIFHDKWTLAGNMRAARDALATVLIGDDLYVAGGRNNTEKAARSDAVEIFNIRTGGRTRKAAKLLKSREGCRAVALDNNVVCVLGGFSGEKILLSSVEVYDKREGKWTTGVIVPDMPNACSYFGFAACA